MLLPKRYLQPVFGITLRTLLILAVVCVFVASRDTAIASDWWTANCKEAVLVDYGRPFRQMKPIHRIPDTGELPFGPKRVRAYMTTNRIFSGGGSIRFQLMTADGYGLPVDLDWKLVSTLARVKRTGAVAKVVSSKHGYVGDLSPQGEGTGTIELSHRVSRRPAFYRLENIFFDSSGKRLAKFFEYFRVIKKHVRVRLSVGHRHLRPGDDLIWAVENFGTEYVTFGPGFTIDRFVDSHWRRDPLTPDGFIQPALSIPGGLRYACRALQLPQEAEPGHYRIRKAVDIELSGSRLLSADFFVSP